MNLEIMKARLKELDLFEISHFCISGQMALSVIKQILSKYIGE